MKRIGYLYESICSLDNCREAIRDAMHGKKKRGIVRKVRDNLEEYAEALHQLLADCAYKPSPYRSITEPDPSGKLREIQVPPFWPDRCVHHALMRVLEPIIASGSYYWSCGCQKKRGISHGMRGMERVTLGPNCMKEAKYCLKMDIKKFYPSIPHDKLMERFRRKIKDEKVIALIERIVRSCEKGVPLGNYTSAWFAHFYLQDLDTYIKAGKKNGGLGAKHYIRYVDDMTLPGRNKRELHRMRREIERFLWERLGLRLKGNWQVFLVRKDEDERGRPIDFLGYCFCRGYTTLRKRNAMALMRRSRRIRKKQAAGEEIPYKMAAGFIARTAQAKHCDSQNLKRDYIDTVSIKGLKEVIRNESKRRLRATRSIQHRGPAGNAGTSLRPAI